MPSNDEENGFSYTKLASVPEETKQTWENAFSRKASLGATPKPMPLPEKKPWLRLVAMFLSRAILSGLCPGSALWIDLLAKSGVYGYTCRDDQTKRDYPCDYQYFSLTFAFTTAKMLSVMVSVVTGTLYESYGGRLLGTCGGVMVCVGFVVLQTCVIFSESLGLGWPSHLMVMAILLTEFGSLLTYQGVYSMHFHFADIGRVIFGILGASTEIAALVPLALSGYVTVFELSLEQGLFSWIILLIVATVVFWFACPSQEEYLEQAEKVLGQKLHKQRARMSAYEVLRATHRAAHKILMQDKWDHMFFLIVVSLSGLWAQIYISIVADYAGHLFYGSTGSLDNNLMISFDAIQLTSDSQADLDPGRMLASITVICSTLTGFFILPGVSYLVDQHELHGAIYLIAVSVVVEFIGWYSVLQVSWFFQIVAVFAASFINGLVGVLFGIRALAFAPPSKHASFVGCNSLYCGALTVLFITIAQSWMANMPYEHDRFYVGFDVLCGIGSVGFCIYLIVFYFIRFPSSPVLMPEEIEAICRSYGCKTLQDIAFILHSEKDSKGDIRARLSTNDQLVHDQLVMTIDCERIAEKMKSLSIDAFGKAMKSGFMWRRDLLRSDMEEHVFGVALGGSTMRTFLNKIADISRFGKDSAKTVDQLENELAKGRSRFVAGKDGVVQRQVNLVALRIYTNTAYSKMVLVQVRESFADGREREKVQLPGTKRAPNDTLEGCVEKICAKIGIAYNAIEFCYKESEVSRSELESPSYPGVFTVYNKTIVPGYVNLSVDPTRLKKIGLPTCESFQRVNSRSQMTYFFEWKKESLANALLEQEAGQQDFHDTHPEKQAERRELRSASELLWSLQVGSLTKRLLYLMEMSDKDGLETWLLKEPIDNIRNAIRNLGSWPHTDPDKVFEDLLRMVPRDHIVTLLKKRKELQGIIVDMFVEDLARSQQDLRKHTKAPFCTSGHPLWPCTDMNLWSCNNCEKQHVKPERRGSHYRCSRCNIDVCKSCASKLRLNAIEA